MAQSQDATKSLIDSLKMELVKARTEAEECKKQTKALQAEVDTANCLFGKQGIKLAAALDQAEQEKAFLE